MKQFLILCCIISITILTGCNQIRSKGLSQTELFEKKQECISYEKDVLKKTADGYRESQSKINDIFL